MSQLAGKTLLVSGAGSGIGRAAARLFKERGAELILLGRRGEALQDTLPDAYWETLDHSDDVAVSSFADRCPVLDGMFLSAGQLVRGSVESTALDEFERMIAANLRGPWLLCHHLASRIRDGGSVVLVGSNIGIRPIPDSAAYCVSKAGLHMLAQVLALEWASRSIRVNALAPGPVRTPMVEERLRSSLDPDGDLARLAAVNPLRRMGAEEDIAMMAVHLLSDESRWTTGAIIPVDGGATAVM